MRPNLSDRLSTERYRVKIVIDVLGLSFGAKNSLTGILFVFAICMKCPSGIERESAWDWWRWGEVGDAE